MGARSLYRKRFRHRTLLTGALLTVVVSAACSFLAARSCQALNEQNAKELESVARIAAQQIEPELHSKLSSDTSIDDPTYRRQTDKLALVQQSVRNIRFIYTFRRSASGLEFVLDPTLPGDIDSDGVEEKSYPGDPVEKATPGMLSALSEGRVGIDPEPDADKWGTWISGYAPIKDRTGKVVAAVGVDRGIETLALQHREIWRNSLIVGLLAILVCWSALLALSSRAEPQAVVPVFLTKIQSKRRVFEFIVLAAGATLVTQAVGVGTRIRDLADQRSHLMTRTRLVREAESLLQRSPGMDTRSYAARASALGNGLIKNGLPSIGSALPGANVRSSDESGSNLMTVTQRLAAVAAESAADLIELESESQSLNEKGIFLVALAVLMALGTLAVLRLTSNIEKRLDEATLTRQLAQQDVQNLLTCLPVGLMAFAGSDCVLKNDAWSNLFVSPETDPVAGLLDSVPPADHERLSSALEAARAGEQPNPLVHKTTGGPEWVETRFVPVHWADGAIRYVVAVSIDVERAERAHREVEQKNAQLGATLDQLEDALEGFVRAMVRAIEAKDIYTAGHSERVMEYSLMIGHELGLGPYEMRVLQMGTLVHDLGKIGIPDDVLMKPGRLTDDEFDTIKKHPEFGVNIMAGIQWLEDCLPIVRWHHERLDGSGYPDRLSGAGIPLLVRIASVADVFDAMTSTRSYRPRIEIRGVLAYLRQEAESGKLDPVVLDALESALAHRNSLPQDFEADQAA